MMIGCDAERIAIYAGGGEQLNNSPNGHHRRSVASDG